MTETFLMSMLESDNILKVVDQLLLAILLCTSIVILICSYGDFTLQ